MQAPAPLAEVFTEWDALAERLDAPPFLRPGWFAAWSRAFADGRLEVLIAPSEDGLAGVLPILRLGGMVRSPTNDHTHHFGLLAQDQDAARLLARSLFSLVIPPGREAEYYAGLRANRPARSSAATCAPTCRRE